MHDMQAHDKATTENNWKTPGATVSGRHNTPPLWEDLVPRSRMAPEGNERGREEVKLSCFLTKEWNQRTLEVEQLERKKATKMKKVENIPLEKRNKEEQIRVALRLKRDARLDKAKRTWAKGHNTQVKWIGMKRTWSLTKWDDGLRKQHDNASGTKE